MTFQLASQLATDTVDVGPLELSQVLLTNDARFPWLILVPRRDAMRDLVDLDAYDQATLLREVNQTGLALKALFAPDKLNIASLGNMVPQLHIHVIARHTGDAAWPAPVWNVGTPEPYDAKTLEKICADLQTHLSIAA